MNAETAQQYARWSGILYLITIVAGGWGESHVPDTLLLAHDLPGTVQRVADSVGLFRSSFAAYLVEAACDITLNVLLYALLRPVSRNLSLLATCFGLMGTATCAAAELLYLRDRTHVPGAGVRDALAADQGRRSRALGCNAAAARSRRNLALIRHRINRSPTTTSTPPNLFFTKTLSKIACQAPAASTSPLTSTTTTLYENKISAEELWSICYA